MAILPDDIRKVKIEKVGSTNGVSSITPKILADDIKNLEIQTVQPTSISPTPLNDSDRVQGSSFFGMFSDLKPIDEGLLPGIDQQAFRARNQKGLDQFGNFLAQAGAEIVGGTIEGIGYLFDIEEIQKTSDGLNQEWGNFLSDFGKGIKEKSRELFPIYERAQGTFDPLDSGWWASNGVSIFSTLSLLLPAIGATRGIAALGKVMGIGKTVGAVLPAVAEPIAQAVISRHMENMMEASQVFTEIKEDRLRRGKSLADATESASMGAASSYSSNWAMLMQDIPQYMILSRGFRSRAPATRKVNAALKAQGLSTEIPRGLLVPFDMITEGFEEAYQFGVAEEAKYLTDVKDGLREDDSLLSSRLREYTKEGELWTAAVFGALGAGVFQTVGRAVARGISGTSGTKRREAEAQRIDEINGRNATITYFNKRLKEVDQLGDPVMAAVAEAELLREMAIKAAVNGNSGNFIEWMQNLRNLEKEKKEELGIDNEFTTKLEERISDIKQIESEYNKNLRIYDPRLAEDITRQEFVVSKLDKQKPEIQARIIELEAGINTLGKLTGTGKEIFDLTTQIRVAERKIKLAKDALKGYEVNSTADFAVLQRERLEKATKETEKLKTQIATVRKEGERTKEEVSSDSEIIKSIKSLGTTNSLIKEKTRLSLLEEVEKERLDVLTQLKDPKFLKTQDEKVRVAGEITKIQQGIDENDIPTVIKGLDQMEKVIKNSKLTEEDKKFQLGIVTETRESLKNISTKQADENAEKIKEEREIGEFEEVTPEQRARRVQITNAIQAIPSLRDVSSTKRVSYQGKEGYIEQDGQSFVFVLADNPNQIFEIPIPEDRTADSKLFTFGIFLVEEHSVLDEIDILENGNFVMRGTEYVNRFKDTDNAMQAINRNEDGEVISVTLFTLAGKQRTFKKFADELAYLITIEHITKSQDETIRAREAAGQRAIEESEREEPQGETEDTGSTAAEETRIESEIEEVNETIEETQGGQTLQDILDVQAQTDKEFLEGLEEGEETSTLEDTDAILTEENKEKTGAKKTVEYYQNHPDWKKRDNSGDDIIFDNAKRRETVIFSSDETKRVDEEQQKELEKATEPEGAEPDGLELADDPDVQALTDIITGETDPNDLEDKPIKLANSPAMGFQLTDDKTAIQVDEEGKPTLRNPSNNISLQANGNPNIQIGDEVTFELSSAEATNDEWEAKKDTFEEENFDQLEPIYVLWKGERIGILQANHPDRTTIHSELKSGNSPKRYIASNTNNQGTFSKVISPKNLANKRISLRKHHFLSIREALGTQWIPQQDGTFKLGTTDPHIITTKGIEDLPPGSVVVLDLDNSPDKMSQDLSSTTFKIEDDPNLSQRGQVWVAVMTPSGVYMAVKVHTSQLDKTAREKVIDLILNTPVDQSIAGQVNEIVHSNSDPEFASSPFFLRVTQGEQVAIMFRDGNGQTMSIELEEFRRAMKGNGIGTAQIKILNEEDIDEGKSRPHKLITQSTLSDYNIRNEFNKFLGTKRYNIQKRLLNVEGKFISPVTDTSYTSYNEYLSSSSEVQGEVSILSSDIHNVEGNVFFDVGMSFTSKPTKGVQKESLRMEREEKEIPPDVSEHNPFDDTTEQPLFRLGEPTGDKLNVEEASDWLTERGIDVSVFPKLSLLGDKTIQGYFKRGTIFLWEGADVGTEYHEAFHAVFRIWTTDQDQQILLAEARERYGQDLTDLELEEQMAEEFRRFVLAKQKPVVPGAIGRFLTKIWNYIQTYLGNRGEIDELYDRIEGNKIDKKFERPVTSISPDPVFSLKSGFTSQGQRDIVEHINTLFLDQVIKARDEERLVSPKEIYNLLHGSILAGAFKEKDTEDFLDTGDVNHTTDIERAKAVFEQLKGVKSLADQDIIIQDAGLERSMVYGLYIRIYRGWFDNISTDERENMNERGWRTLSKNNLVKYGLKVIEDEGERIEESSEGERLWNKSHLEDNNRDKLSGDVKHFLSFIKSKQRNRFGFYTFIPFERIYSKVTEATNNAVSFDDMLKRMHELSGKSPELLSVIEELNRKDTQGNRLWGGDFVADFYKNLALTNVNFLGAIEEVTFDSKGKASMRVRYFDANVSRVSRLLIDRWRNNARSLDGSGIYTKNKEGNWLSNKTKLDALIKLQPVIEEVKTNRSEVTERHLDALVKYLNIVGIDIEKATLKEALVEGVKIGNKVIKPVTLENGTVESTQAKLYRYLYDAKSDVNDDGSRSLFELEKNLRDNKDIFETQSGIIRRIVNVQREFETQTNVSFMNAEGKLIYPMNNITTFDRYWNGYKNYDPTYRQEGNKNSSHVNFWNEFVDNLWRDKYFNPINGDTRYASLFLSQIKTSKLFRGILQWQTFEAFKRRGESITQNTYDNLTEVTTVLNRYNAFINNTSRSQMKVAAPIFADKNHMSFITIPRISRDRKLMHKTYPHSIRDMLKAQVIQDLARAGQAQRDVDNNNPLIENYHTGAKRAFKYGQFEFLNNKKKYPEAAALMEFARSSSESQLLDLQDGRRTQTQQLDVVMDNINEYIEAKVQEELREFERLNIDQGSRNKFDSTWTQLFSSKENLVRDFVTVDIIAKNEIRKVTAGDVALYKSYEEFSKRYGSIQTPGLESLETSMSPEKDYGDFSNYNTGIIEDTYTITKELETLRGKSPQLDAILGLYKKDKGSNKTDAMGFITIDKHRAKMRGQSIWTKAHERAYKNYKSLPIGSREFVTPEGFRPLLTPLKTVHDGMYYMPALGRSIRQLHKHAKFPLIEEFTRGSELFDGLRRRMELEAEFSDMPRSARIDEINTVTGVKIGRFGVVNIANTDGTFNVEVARGMNVTTLSTKFERSPQVIPNNNVPTIWGSQIRKLIIANLKSHFKDSYSIAGRTKTGKQVYDLYHKATGQLLDLSRQELFDDLGYTEFLKALENNANELAPAVQNAKLKMLKNLRTMLQNEVDDRELPDNYAEVIQIDKVNGSYEFRIPLAFPTYQRRFEQILITLFKRKLLLQRMNGKAMVQIAELGNVKQHGDLQFIREDSGVIRHAEVAIPYSMAEELNLPKDENGQFILDSIPPDLLNMVGYRIPTHGKQSMLPIKVIRILPAAMGKVILVPGAITTQMGSDFDIDKLFIMMPNYEVVQNEKTDFDVFKNHLKEYNLNDEDLRALILDDNNVNVITSVSDREALKLDVRSGNEKLRKRRESPSKVRKVAYNADKLEGASREQLQNLIIDINEGILLNKNHLAEMLNPVASTTIKETAKLLGRPEENLDAQDPKTERILEDRNKIGNTGVGIYVNALNGAAITQYSDQVVDGVRRHLQLTDKFKLTLDGTIYTDLTRERDDVGDHITYSYSELLDTSVDNANDPVMSFVNDNSFTAPVTVMLLRTGAIIQKNKEGFLTKGNVLPILLRTQPIIKQLTSDFKNEEGTLGNLAEFVNKVGRSLDSNFDIFDQDETMPMTTTDLIEGVRLSVSKIKSTKDITEKDRLTAIQLNALINFFHLHNAGRMLGKVNRIFNTDRVKDLNSVAAIEEFDDIIDNVEDKTRNKSIEGFEPILIDNAYPITLHYLRGREDAGRFADLFFPFRSNAMIEVKKIIRQAINRDGLTADLINTINREAFLWLATVPQSSPVGELYNEKTINELFIGDNNIVVQMQNVKKLESEFPSLKDNRFLQRLNGNNDNIKDGNVLNTLTFDYSFSMTQEEQNELIDHFRLLLRHKDERIRTFGKNLIHYHILSIGFNPVSNSFSEFIPVEAWQNAKMGFTGESLVSYLRVAMKNMDKRSIFTTNDQAGKFVDDLLENNRHVKGLIPRGRPIKATSAKLTKFPKSVVLKDQVYARYAIRYDRSLNKDVMFKLVDNETGDYKRINPRGVPFKLKEYHMDKSAINKDFVEGELQKVSEESKLSRAAAEKLLSSLEATFGIKGEIINKESEIYAGRYLNGVPIINLAYAGLDTPFHEFSHPWINLIEKRNKPLFDNLAKQLQETEHGKLVLEKTKARYPELKGNELIKEAMVTALGELAAANTDAVSGSPLLRVAKRIIDRIRQWMEQLLGIDRRRIRPEEFNESTTLQNLADLISSPASFTIEAEGTRETPLLPGEPTGITSDNLQKLDKESELLNKIVNTLKLKEQRLKKSLKTGKEVEIARVALEKRLAKAQTKAGIIDFVGFAERQTLTQLNAVLEIEKKIDDSKDFDERRKLLKRLVRAEDSVSSYEIVSEVFDALRGEEIGNTSLNKILNAQGKMKIDKQFSRNVIAPIQNRVTQINQIYRDLGKRIAVEFLMKVNRDPTLTKEDLDRMLTLVTEDITTTQRLMNGLAESNDQILALVDRVVSNQRAKVLLKTTEFKNTKLRPALEELEKFQQSQGTPITNLEQLFDFMLQRDKNGELTGRYLKPDMLDLSKDDPRYKFAKVFDDAYNDSWKLLPEGLRRGNQLIPIIKSTSERLFEGRGIKELAKESFQEALVKRLDDVDLIQEVSTDEKGNEFRFLPVRYTNNIEKIDKKDISLDMGGNLLKFMTMAENFTAMQSVITELEVVKDLVAERDVEVKKGGILHVNRITREPVRKKGRETNSFKRLDDYFTMIIYGQRKRDEGSWNFLGTHIDVRKSADLLARYTSFNVLAFNLYSGINNVVIAQVMNAIEGHGGQFYDSKHFWSAQTEYWKILPGFLQDATQRFNDSTMGIWLETYDVLLNFDEFGNHVKGNQFVKRIGLHNAFFLHQSGEHMIQTQLAIAMAKSHRIVGKKIYDYNTWVIENDKKFNKESKKEFETLPDVYSNITKKDGKSAGKIPILQSEMVAFTERIKGVYSRLHGNYARKDQAAAQMGSLGMLAMLFRKWLKPGWDRRFEKDTFDGRDRFDQRLGVNVAGNYTIAANFLMQLHKEYKQIGGVRIAYAKQWEDLPQWKKQAIHKVTAEAAYVTASMAVVFALTQIVEGDDDERSWLFHMGEYQAYRLKSELLFYIPPFSFTEVIRIIRSPAASLNSFEKVGKVLTQLVPATGFERFEKGDNKGELKLLKYSRDLVPLWNQIERAITDVEENANWMKR